MPLKSVIIFCLSLFAFSASAETCEESIRAGIQGAQQKPATISYVMHDRGGEIYEVYLLAGTDFYYAWVLCKPSEDGNSVTELPSSH